MTVAEVSDSDSECGSDSECFRLNITFTSQSITLDHSHLTRTHTHAQTNKQTTFINNTSRAKEEIMPKKGKKRKFHGTPAWMVKEEHGRDQSTLEEDGESSSSSLVSPNYTDISSIPTASSSEESESPTVSQRKLRHSRVCLELTDDSSMSPEPELPNGSISEGYRLMDLACLSDALSKVHKCRHGKLNLGRVCQFSIFL